LYFSLFHFVFEPSRVAIAPISPPKKYKYQCDEITFYFAWSRVGFSTIFIFLKGLPAWGDAFFLSFTSRFYIFI